VKARDPLTLSLAPAILMAAALAAGYGPAWRASRIDPWSALRDE
jgi:macrolide transport system ATP-binding/permease protein